MKSSTKVFCLLALVVICTSSKSMSIKKLIQKEPAVKKNEVKDTIYKKRTFLENDSKDVVHKKRTFPENNSVVSSANVPVPYGSFIGWYFKQTYSIKKSIETYIAECFAKNCSEKFWAKTKSLLDEALINHLEEHLKNDPHGVIAEKPMHLSGKVLIFSIKIKLPTAQLCKDSKGTYYNYKCNECETVQGRKDKAFQLNNDCKKHIFTCCKSKIQKILDDNNKQKDLLPCCLDKKDLNQHLWISHFKVENK